MFDWSTYKGPHTWLPKNTLFLTRHGSRSYGTDIAGSDLDIKGIALGPPEHYLGFGAKFEQVAQHGPDLTIYELTKFFRLASEGNPSVLELLFIDSSDYLLVTPAFERILEHRNEFLSREVLRFESYAYGMWLAVQKSVDPTKGPAPNRRDVTERYGYDTKSAYHAIRTQRMALEALSEGLCL